MDQIPTLVNLIRFLLQLADNLIRQINFILSLVSMLDAQVRTSQSQYIQAALTRQ